MVLGEGELGVDGMARGLELVSRGGMVGVVAGTGIAGFADMGDNGRVQCPALLVAERKDPGPSLSCWVAVGEDGFQGCMGAAHPIEAVQEPWLMRASV